jgi:hypothetical protein
MESTLFFILKGTDKPFVCSMIFLGLSQKGLKKNRRRVTGDWGVLNKPAASQHLQKNILINFSPGVKKRQQVIYIK